MMGPAMNSQKGELAMTMAGGRSQSLVSPALVLVVLGASNVELANSHAKLRSLMAYSVVVWVSLPRLRKSRRRWREVVVRRGHRQGTSGCVMASNASAIASGETVGHLFPFWVTGHWHNPQRE